MKAWEVYCSFLLLFSAAHSKETRYYDCGANVSHKHMFQNRVLKWKCIQLPAGALFSQEGISYFASQEPVASLAQWNFKLYMQNGTARKKKENHLCLRYCLARQLRPISRDALCGFLSLQPSGSRLRASCTVQAELSIPFLHVCCSV